MSARWLDRDVSQRLTLLFYSIGAAFQLSAYITDPYYGSSCVQVVVIAQLLGILPSLMLVAATWRHSASVQSVMMLRMQGRAPITMILLRDGENPSLLAENYSGPR